MGQHREKAGAGAVTNVAPDVYDQMRTAIAGPVKQLFNNNESQLEAIVSYGERYGVEKPENADARTLFESEVRRILTERQRMLELAPLSAEIDAMQKEKRKAIRDNVDTDDINERLNRANLEFSERMRSALDIKYGYIERTIDQVNDMLQGGASWDEVVGSLRRGNGNAPTLRSAARPIFGAERRPSAAREMAQVIADRSEDLRMRVVSALQTRNGLNDPRVRSEMRGLLALISRAQETFEIGKSVDQLIAQADRLYDAYQNAGTFDRPRLAQQTNRARAAAARAAQDFDRFDRRPITDADLGRADQRLTIVSQMIDDARRRNIPTPVARIVEELTSTSSTRYEFGTTPPRQPAPRAARAPSAPRAPRKPRGGGLL